MSPRDVGALMASAGLATAGGVCIGSGIAIGAYSDLPFLAIAIPLVLVGIAMMVGAFTRTENEESSGDPVPVTVDLIDRSAPNLDVSSTLIAGEAHPPGDTPFRFQTNAALSSEQLTEIVRNGRGKLPSDALGDRADTPTTEHRVMRVHAPAALAAVAAMWATILLPPDDFWDLSWPALSHSSSPAVAGDAAVDSDARPLWEWYADAIAHLRAEAPESLDSILGITVHDTYVQIDTYLGGDRHRFYEGRTTGWTSGEAETSQRSRDTFSIDELSAFNAEDFLSRAAAMLPDDQRKQSTMEITRDSADIFGSTRPVLIEGGFGESADITVQGTADGAIAPWWSEDDIVAGLQQVGDALTARGVSAAEPRITELVLEQADFGDGGAFSLEYYRGAVYYETGAEAGEFTSPDAPGNENKYPRFRFSDIDSGVLSRVRDDAMRRFDVDPVDLKEAEFTIAAWGSDGDQREDDIVIEVDFSGAEAGAAIYTLAGTFLAEESD